MFGRPGVAKRGATELETKSGPEGNVRPTTATAFGPGRNQKLNVYVELVRIGCVTCQTEKFVELWPGPFENKCRLLVPECATAVLTSDPRWAQLAAVRAGKVFVTDGHQFFNRPGPRLLESAQILAEMLHPDACHFGHRDRNWEKL